MVVISPFEPGMQTSEPAVSRHEMFLVHPYDKYPIDPSIDITAARIFISVQSLPDISTQALKDA